MPLSPSPTAIATVVGADDCEASDGLPIQAATTPRKRPLLPTLGIAGAPAPTETSNVGLLKVVNHIMPVLPWSGSGALCMVDGRFY